MATIDFNIRPTYQPDVTQFKPNILHSVGLSV